MVMSSWTAYVRLVIQIGMRKYLLAFDGMRRDRILQFVDWNS